ncbi:MAG: hypothetical protein JSS31_13270 [Proteobacteria bacterium]|nr:hypothetical protein [Pseudomonadota bacterium]MBS0494893.1 hypothetical protein [Pseudomonadota bacterium]
MVFLLGLYCGFLFPVRSILGELPAVSQAASAFFFIHFAPVSFIDPVAGGSA